MQLLDRCHLVFQPIFQLSEQRIIGYEALLRGPSDPEQIVDQAVQQGVIAQLDQEIHRMAIRTIGADLAKKQLFLNCHPLSLRHLPLDDEIYKKVSGTIVFEITETERISSDTLHAFSQEAKRRGYQVAIDDFGSGYNNISVLTHWKPDYVKLDRNLIQQHGQGYFLSRPMPWN